MKKIVNPAIKYWEALSKRPVLQNNQLTNVVSTILQNVKQNGDKALIEYAKIYDNVIIENLLVSEDEIKTSKSKVEQKLKDSINIAYKNINTFHKAQLIEEPAVDVMPGVKCWRKTVAIDKVGLYIPGGSAPLFSTVLMLAIPAVIAGCKEIIVCTPPNKSGKIDNTILYVLNLIGIKKIFKVGGAQAIAAMSYGTETIPKVYKVFGPGNQYVTKAKELIQLSGVAIDMPAGPSELLVIADETCNPWYVAADLLSQAEHGVDSQVVLVSNSKSVIKECLTKIEKQLQALPRKEIAKKALSNSMTILFDDLSTCVDFSNFYAPEHLILSINNAEKLMNKVINAGSVFIGNYSCEAIGDYASGTNHTLPTNRFARNYSGVSVDSFVKKITYQKLSKEGLKNIGEAVEIMAEAENLFAHKNAVSIRLKDLKDV